MFQTRSANASSSFVHTVSWGLLPKAIAVLDKHLIVYWQAAKHHQQVNASTQRSRSLLVKALFRIRSSSSKSGRFFRKGSLSPVHKHGSDCCIDEPFTRFEGSPEAPQACVQPFKTNRSKSSALPESSAAQTFLRIPAIHDTTISQESVIINVMKNTCRPGKS